MRDYDAIGRAVYEAIMSVDDRDELAVYIMSYWRLYHDEPAVTNGVASLSMHELNLGRFLADGILARQGKIAEKLEALA